MSALRTLHDRLAAASKPHGDLDVEMMRVCCGWRSAVSYPGWGWDPNDVHTQAPALTSSIDAAVAFVQTMLPGCARLVDATAPVTGIRVDLYRHGSASFRVSGLHKHEPIATCLALLKILDGNTET